MTKKQFLLDVLEKLDNARPLARDLRKFLQLDALDNAAVNGIVELMKQMAVYVKNTTVKEHMLQVAEKLETMKNAELQDHILEQQEAEHILSTL